MGRHRRQSGHRQGQKPLAKVAPKQVGQPMCHSLCAYHTTQSLNPNRPWPGNIVTEGWSFEATVPLSPESSRSALSGDSFAQSVNTSYTSRLAGARHLSPRPSTPTSSNVSAYHFAQIAEHPSSAHRHYGGFPTTDFSAPADVQMSGVELIGIDSRALTDDTQQFLITSPVYVSHSAPSSSSQQRYPRTHGPWAPQFLRQEDPFLMEDPMEGLQEAVPGQDARERAGGGRTGPLSPTGRTQASEVRRLGACLRCTIMREKCDASPSCHNCTTKERRKLPRMCIRARADWPMIKSILFPIELTERLRTESLFRYLANASFTFSNQPQFKISLDINVGKRQLALMVREFLPLDIPEVQHTYRSLVGADGVVTYGRNRVWSPPINIFIEPGELNSRVKSLRGQIMKLFVQVLACPEDWVRWATIYFPKEEEDFQADILILLGKYYRADIPEHGILQKALSLLWFEHLLLTRARVPAEAVHALESRLESRRPIELPQDARVVPDTINRFIKGVVLPMAEEVGQKITETLHEMMFKIAVGQKSTPASMDLCLCLAFVLLIYLAKTQHALVLLADAPSRETGRDYAAEDARASIEQMDEVVAEYLVQFHKYTLSRRSSRSPVSSPAEDSVFEEHAREFDLNGKLRDLAGQYVHERPASFALGELDLGTFRHMNVRRLCWKLFQNVE
ncbi:hypothetical protein EDD36DRAFT_223001 [Exophiala viscosa]|uniref:Zn(2)-C6 fungal-type domain-containing protein n=1 Tax=Exophiala viscosa TaxID=2486360 RepID=A0AAN6IED3_9EURO|nr:hypothetical protein EDD36DRAFT_223001 [Exophiala viscosa]